MKSIFYLLTSSKNELQLSGCVFWTQHIEFWVFMSQHFVCFAVKHDKLHPIYEYSIAIFTSQWQKCACLNNYWLEVVILKVNLMIYVKPKEDSWIQWSFSTKFVGSYNIKWLLPFNNIEKIYCRWHISILMTLSYLKTTKTRTSG